MAPSFPPSRPSPDPDLLARWIAVAQLLASAAELQARRSGAWPGLALITADTANEAVLGLIAAESSNPPPERASFSELYEIALAELEERGQPMRGPLRADVLRTHRARNSAVHLGLEPATRTVERALETARELRGVAIDALDVLAAFRQSGPVRAVAEVVAIKAVSTPLAEADRLLGDGMVVEAADQAAVALDAALRRVVPALRSPWRAPRPRMDSLFGYPAPFNWRSRDLEKAFEIGDDRIDRLEAWILAIGLGLPPAQLDQLRRVVGIPIYTLGGPQPHRVRRDEDVDLSRQTVESALLLTADVIYRLWQGDGIRLRERWETDDAPSEAPPEES